MAVHEPDTDINTVKQDKSNLAQWPALVHRYTPEKPGTEAKDFKDAKPEAYAHKRVESAEEHKAAMQKGWYATPQKAVEAATKKPAPVTVQDADPLADVDATDDSGAPVKARKA